MKRIIAYTIITILLLTIGLIYPAWCMSNGENIPFLKAILDFIISWVIVLICFFAIIWAVSEIE